MKNIPILKRMLSLVFTFMLALQATGQISTCPTPVAQPATNITNTSASIDWIVQSPTATNSFVMRYRVVSNVINPWVNGIPASKPVLLSSLTPGTTYEWQIAQVCSSSTGAVANSAYSNSIFFTTSSSTASCPVPTGLLTDSISTNGARLSWTAVTGATGYNVRYRVVNTSTWLSIASSGNIRLITNLLAGTNYEWQVQTLCGSAAGTASGSAFSASQFFTTLAAAPCTTPNGLLTDSITATSARVSWSPVSGALAYGIRYRVTGSATWTSLTVSGNARVLTNLSPGTNYEWQVQTLCGTTNTNVSTYSASQLFTTLATAVCNTPAGLITDSITSNSARLRWTAVTGVFGYNVRYRVANTSTWTVVASSSNVRIITNLLPATAYEWQVQSVCSNTSATGVSTYSVSMFFTTLTQATCPVPSGLTSGSITSSSAILSWNSTGVAQYNVRYKPAASTTWTTVTATTNSRLLAGLLASTNYEWQVRSICASTSSSTSTSLWSASAFFTTTASVACLTPTGLMVDSITASTARISWSPVNGVTGYQLSYRKTGTTAWTTLSVSGNARIITGLLPASAYECRVRSICPSSTNTINASAWSASIIFSTTPMMMVFPNPASSKLNIQLNENAVSSETTFRIYNYNGTPVQNIDELQSRHAINEGIDVSQFDNGTYYLEVMAGKQIERIRFVIKH